MSSPPKPQEIALRYLPLVRRIARAFPPQAREDLIQDGIVGLLEAARQWDPRRGPYFPLARWWVLRLFTDAARAEARWRSAQAMASPAYAPPPSEPDDAAALLNTLTPRQSSILRRSLGLGCPPEPLRAIGASLGISGERVRQVRDLALRRLRPLAVWRCHHDLPGRCPGNLTSHAHGLAAPSSSRPGAPTAQSTTRSSEPRPTVAVAPRRSGGTRSTGARSATDTCAGTHCARSASRGRS